MKSILAATDFSSHAAHAMHRAALLASAASVDTVELLHVLPARPRWGRWTHATRDETGKFERTSVRMSAAVDVVQSMTDASVEGRIVRGRVVDTLATAARSAKLLVMGSPTTMPWLRPFVGSTLKLIRRTRVPVLVVRRSPTSWYRRVLVALDIVTGSERALAALRLVAPGARVDIVHAYRAAFEGKLQYAGVALDVVADYRAAAGREALFQIADLVSSARAVPNLTAHVVHGHAATRVLDKAEELGADLVVVTKKAKSWVEEWFVPGVTSRLLEAASADVLVI